MTECLWLKKASSNGSYWCDFQHVIMSTERKPLRKSSGQQVPLPKPGPIQHWGPVAFHFNVQINLLCCLWASMNYLRSSKKTKAMAPEAYLLGGDSTHLEKNIKKSRLGSSPHVTRGKKKEKWFKPRPGYSTATVFRCCQKPPTLFR